MVSLSSSQSSYWKSPGFPSASILPTLIFNVSRVLGDNVALRFLFNLYSVPSCKVMISSSGGLAAEGNYITVMLPYDSPSTERESSNCTVLVMFSASPV